ncbi:MFS transporter [Ruania zhangjianzhongii]|uniref:MFS transporter n=1 Tax=Ruania zhangjianzhongii TaxID=2603206 RepID=UPI0011C84F9B|nr:MFS transporter [Ruania zhangjianzhongii]
MSSGQPGTQRAVPFRRLGGLTWAHFLNDGASNYLPGVLPAVLVTIGQPVQMAAVLVTALTVGQALQPVAGRIADRLGGKSLVLIGLAMTSVGGGLIGVVRSTWLLVVLLVLIGVGNAFFHPQAIASVRQMISGRQGLLTSAFLVGGELGRGLWPTIASLIVARAGLEYLWLVAVPGVLTLPFLVRWLPALPPKRARGPAIQLSVHARPMALLIGYQGVRMVGIYAFATFIPVLWSQRDQPLVAGASLITTMMTVGVIGNIGGGYLTDRIGSRATLIISAVGSAVLIVPTAYLTGPMAWAAAGLLGVMMFLSASTTVLLGQDIFAENPSMGSGIAIGLANGIGAVLVLVIGIWVGDSVQPVFWLLGLLSLASAALVPLFDRRLVG